MKHLAVALLFAGMATNAFAAVPIEVKDSSFREADGHRVQQLSVVVDASPAEVWKAFTTDEGFTRWAVPVAHVTVANGGMMESSYKLSSKIGDPDNIRNEIVAYLPDRLLVLRNVHVPKGAPFDPVLIGTLRTVITFEPADGGKTRVTEAQIGYGDGPGYASMYQHFRDGNAEELQSLAQSFLTGPVNWKAEAAAMTASVRKPPAK